MAKTKLSIIITHYKTPNLLLACLSSIKKNIRKIDYEIFVGDSQANTGTAFLLQYYYPQAKHLAFRKNVGYARLVNEGLKHATGEFILILNADVLIENEKSIRKMMDFLDKNPKVGIVGPKLLNIDGSLQKSYFREYTLGAVFARRTIWRRTRWGKRALERFEFQKVRTNKPLRVDWVMGSAMMTKKSLVDKIGPLDTRYFIYFEDVDWCRRFREKGYEIYYLPTAEMKHFHLKASDSKKGIIDIFINKFTRRHIISYFKYLLKWRLPQNAHKR